MKAKRTRYYKPFRKPAVHPNMNSLEWRATLGLGALYALRMVGMFMVLPVFALYARTLPGGAAPHLVGLAIGIYGLTQAFLQIPLGMLSDRVGRKPVIVGGMAVFALGSLVAGLSDTIGWIIAGRALQGAGAISSAVAALLADTTRAQVRTQAMTVLGAGMGAAFVLALVTGPLFAEAIGVDGIFLMTAVLALLSVPLVIWGVPRAEVVEPPVGALAQALGDASLWRLNAGVFALHALLTALFVAAPLALESTLGLPGTGHWKVYLPVLLVSLVPVFPLIRFAEARGRMKTVFLGAVATLAAAELLAAAGHGAPAALVLALLLFFAAFNFLEGALPALISRQAPPERKGAALGVYATAQFLGAFTGGALGGWVLGAGGIGAVFCVMAVLPLVWLAVAAGGVYATPAQRPAA